MSGRSISLSKAQLLSRSTNYGARCAPKRRIHAFGSGIMTTGLRWIAGRPSSSLLFFWITRTKVKNKLFAPAVLNLKATLPHLLVTMRVTMIRTPLDNAEKSQTELKTGFALMRLASKYAFNARSLSSSTSESKSSEPAPCPKAVRFDKVIIRTYPIELGDNPGGTQGPPLTINWKYDEEFSTSVDVFEKTRIPLRRHADKDELWISPVRRHILLQKAGYSARELREAIEEILAIRKQRSSTLYWSKFPLCEMVMETSENIVKYPSLSLPSSQRTEKRRPTLSGI